MLKTENENNDISVKWLASSLLKDPVGASGLLKDNANILRLTDNEANTVLHLVAKSTSHGSLIKTLVEANPKMLNAQNSQGKTPLILACEEFCFNAVEKLMQLNADKKIKDQGGKSVDDYATTPVMKEKLLECTYYPSRSISLNHASTNSELKSECLGQDTDEPSEG